MHSHSLHRHSARLLVLTSLGLLALTVSTPAMLELEHSAASQSQAPTGPAPEDVAAIRSLVSAYYEAYGRADLAAMMALWHKSAGGLNGLRLSLKLEFERRKASFANLEVSVLKADVSGGSARVTVDAAVTVVTDGETLRERWHRDQSFLRQDGEWKLWIDQSASADLAARVARAPSMEERASLMKTEPELVNSEFMEGVSVEGSRALAAGRFELAAELLDLAERLARDARRREVLARTLSRTGSLASVWQQWDAAYARYEEAKAIFEAIGDQREANLCRLNMANARYSSRRYAEALGLYQEAVAAISTRSVTGAPGAPAPPDATQLPGAVHGLANAHYMLGDLTRALEAYERVRSLHERSNYAYGVASALEAIGRVRRDQGEYAAALEAYERAISTARASQLPAIVVTSLRGIVEAHRLQGQYDRSIEQARQAIVLAQSIGDRAGTAELTFEIGLAFAAERRWPDALAAYERALALEQQAGSEERIARALAATGTVLSAQGRHDAALERFRASLAMREKLGDQPRIAWTLVHIGLTLEAKTLHDEALETLHRAMMLFDKEADSGGMGIVHGVVSDVHVARADPERALEHAAQAASYAAANGDLDTLAHARFVAGKAHRLAGATADALGSLEAAVQTLDEMDRLATDVTADRFFGENVAPYHALADMLVTEERVAEALAWTERSRARLLRAIIGRVGARVARGLTPAERDDETTLARDVVSLNNQVDKERERRRPDPDRLATLEAGLAAARRALDVRRAAIYERHPRLAVMRGRAAPPDLATLRSASADRGWPAVSFIITERRLLGFVLAPGRAAPATFAVDIAPADLAARLRAYREMIAQRKDGLLDEARSLYDLLWKPVEGLVGGAPRVVVVPDGVLWALPFETLRDARERYLIESKTIAYAPSLSSLVWRSPGTTAPGPPGASSVAAPPAPSAARVLALGNPIIAAEVRTRLGETRPEMKLGVMPEADREVRLVASVAGPARSITVTGPRARKSVLSQNAGSVGVIHLAVPAVLSDASPMFSEIVLAPEAAAGTSTPTAAAPPSSAGAPPTVKADPGSERPDDGIVTAADIAAWEIAASRTVLSRAENESAGATTGEALIGLSWALDIAGCPTLVVSRWRAESVATPGLMAEMHRQLRATAAAGRASRSTAEALRRAQLSVLGMPSRREPWFWAGFLTVGVDGR